jgi:hypothetical protein
MHNKYRFEISLSKDEFSKLNKDKKISYLFRSSSVGKCAKIFDDYYKSTIELKPAEWYRFYESVMGITILKEVTNKLIELTNLSEAVCYDYVKFRVLGQTWNGMLNEINLIEELKQEFPNIDFKKADYNLDENYFTDWEAYSNGKLFLGLQIKPITYMYMNTPYQNQAKLNHERQRTNYKEKFKVPHFLIYYENGKLYEKQNVLNQINILLTNLI